jgi:LysM repeat protein
MFVGRNAYSQMKLIQWIAAIFMVAAITTGCSASGQAPRSTDDPDLINTPIPTNTSAPLVPGEMVDYVALSGDTLPAVAAHFNSSEAEILDANPNLPSDLTTLPPGLPLKIPAYLLPLTGSDIHILPDSEVVNGPSAQEFDVADEVRRRPGFLVTLTDFVHQNQRPAWDVVEIVAMEYSIHPRLLLTLLEYQTNALTNPFPEGSEIRYPLGFEDPTRTGLYRQLQWAADRLNDGFYGWRIGALNQFDLPDGHLLRPDPWQNAGTVSLYNFFSELYGLDEINQIMGIEGFQETYRSLWGDPFELEIELVPGNLRQPALLLPFQPGVVWDYSAGPHPTWGSSLPMGAIDLAPPAAEGGCASSDVWVTAPIAGQIVRSEDAVVLLDTDGDGDERTGWVLLFFHIAEEDRIAEDTHVELGDLLGHPSCEGGRATGTHMHFARRYNGEWLPAGGTLPMVLDGWVVDYGDEPYLGTMMKGSTVVEACTCTTSANRIFYEFP